MKRLFITFVRPEHLHILIRRLHVIAGIDGKHQHVNQPRFNRHAGGHGVVAAQSDGTDFSFRFQLFRIFNDSPVKHGMEIIDGINVMNHSDIDIICAEPFQKIGESLFRFRKITRPFILSILPYGTEMRLNYKVLTPSQKCVSEC